MIIKPKEWNLTPDEKEFFTDNFQEKHHYEDEFFIYHNGEWYQDRYPIFRVYYYSADYGTDYLINTIKEEGHTYVDEYLCDEVIDTKWFGLLKEGENGQYQEYVEFGLGCGLVDFIEDYFKQIERELDEYRQKRDRGKNDDDEDDFNIFYFVLKTNVG